MSLISSDSSLVNSSGVAAAAAYKWSAHLLFICGDTSGAGKSTTSLAILGSLLQLGYKPNELAYIKPCTKCETIQLVWKFCEAKGIAHQGIGPIRFYEGFTTEVIDGKDEGVEGRHAKIRKAIATIATGRRFVIVDGVGYPAVGSIAGVSNADVARVLGAPVLMIGRPGVGDAVDAMNLNSTFFRANGATVLGAIWNKLPPKSTYHTLDNCRKYVTKYYQQSQPTFGVYGFVPLLDRKGDGSACGACGESTGVCMLRPSAAELKMTEDQAADCDALITHVRQNTSIEQLIADVLEYYGVAVSEWPSSLGVTTSTRQRGTPITETFVPSSQTSASSSISASTNAASDSSSTITASTRV